MPSPLNYHWNKVIGDNETGFRGTNNAPYRTEAWDFIVAGGALYNNLDYSFVAGHEDGTFPYPATQPGGGNTQFRREMKILRDFIHSFDFIRMKPDNRVIKGGVPPSGTARALVEPGRAMAIYSATKAAPDPGRHGGLASSRRPPRVNMPSTLSRTTASGSGWTVAVGG
jgi:hypothetical protein